MFASAHRRLNGRRVQSMGRHLSEEVVHRVHKTNHELDGVDDRIDRLALLCETMWELLIENTDITEEDLSRKFHEIDERDGRRNFRRQRVAQECECGAKIPPARLACQYCGAPAVSRSLFDAV